MDEVVIGMLITFWSLLPIGMGIALYRSDRRVKALERMLRRDAAPPDDRIELLEQRWEQLAQQVDQIAGGQDFLNRVVAQRIERAPASPPPVREITPH